MLTIFKTLHYSIVNGPAEGRRLQLIVINNPNGSPRWICPAGASQPYFLKFYNIAGFKAQAFAWACRVIFYLRLQALFFKTETIYLKGLHDKPLLELNNNRWAIFTGTPGPNNKMLVYQESGHGSCFLKVIRDKNAPASALLETEYSTLNQLQLMNLSLLKVPKPERLSPQAIRLEDISNNGKRTIALQTEHFKALDELYNHTSETASFTSLLQELSSAIREIEDIQDQRLPNGLIKKLKDFTHSIQLKSVVQCLNHGDFTPWNVFLKNEGIAGYDWELASHLPVGYDIFHFIIQKGILIERKRWKDIRQEIEEMVQNPVFQKWFNQIDASWTEYLKLYLLINTCKYLKIYADQTEWHVQVSWLLTTWSEALSDLLQPQKMSARAILTRDCFDFLTDRDYATIKLSHIDPEALPETSDIDVCIEKKDAKLLEDYLRSHPLVSHISILRKSFMASIHVFLRDGSILCLDLIWHFKRKALTTMITRDVLHNAYTNKYGIKCMSPMDESRYIGLFYGLNGKAIPSKYQLGMQVLKHSVHFLDLLLYRNAINNTMPTCLKALIRKQPYNSSFNRLINTLRYTKDILSEFLFSKGLILTFSGVDGAGKSTVIEETTRLIEKKLRKRVIVLRHRPSILPILSAWTKGKAKAEQDSMNSLPRQGKNNSFVSSLLRFSYYYCDYLLGQFFIYLFYVKRGYVILYDRYYFDFINDSRRSNIQLPKKFIRLGYSFLIKPDLNFFLYADPEVILKRKQELDKNTIIDLTSKYRTLFNELSQSSANSYFAIENNVLNCTIEFILQKTILKAA